MWKGCLVDSKYVLRQDEIDALIANYREIGLEMSAGDCKTEDDIIRTCQGLDVLSCSGNPPITKRVLSSLPDVKVVQRFGIGVNSVDLEAAAEMGVLVLNLPGISAQEVSLHATALILDLLRNISYYDRGVRMGEWRKGLGVPCPTMEDLVLGLHGFGITSRLVYKIFHDGFGLKNIIAHDPYVKKEDIPEFDIELVPFDELLYRSDVISTHVHLNRETEHVFDWAAFKKMKASSLIINVSRGGIICEPDLVRALQEGEIRGAGLDVFEEEPLPADSPLTKMENVVLSCHSAFLGKTSKKNTFDTVVWQMEQIIAHDSIPGRYVANTGVVPKVHRINIE